jgi:hypothetical protein
MNIEGILVWATAIVCIGGILVASRPIGGYRKYFRECPLWHSSNDEEQS